MASALTPGRIAQLRARYGTWLMDRFPLPENVALLVLAVVVGLLGGVSAYLFHHLIELTHTLVFERIHLVPGSPLDMLRMVLAPTFGALLASSIVWLLARHSHTHGTATVMESVALQNGRLAARPLMVDVVASGVLIGAGGSAGPEDPSVQIGAVAGSATGRAMRFTGTRARTLVTSGVASVIAAVFNAPIAGIFFAMEIVAGDFSTTLFVPVVLSAVAGSIVGRELLGTEASFQAPPYTLVSPFIETPLYALLGLIAAVVGVALIKAIHWSGVLFGRLPVAAPLRAMLGGLLVGLLALGIHMWLGLEGILGVGYEISGAILHGEGPTGILLLILLIAKFAAVCFTIGAVRLGGSFAPALVLGSMVGGLFGQAVNMLLPGLTAPPAAFALVGMGAVLNAVIRAPLTTVLLLFEITGDYHIILAIMASVVTSQLAAHWLHGESIYTDKLARKGIQLRFGRDVNLLELVTIGEVMTTRPDTVPTTMTLGQLEVEFERTHHHGFPVVDADGSLSGIVTLTDVRHAVAAGMSPATPIERITTRDLVVVYPEQSLNIALRQFALADVGRLPVVDQNNPRRLLGLVRRSDIIKAYQRGMMRRNDLEHRKQQMQIGSASGAHILELALEPGCASDGKAVRDLGLPTGVIITSLQRNGRSLIPRGETVLQGGDLLTVLVPPDQAQQVQACILHGPPDDEPELRYHEIEITEQSPVLGKAVAELDLPPHVLIITLRRNGEQQTVNGDTHLQLGDQLVVLTPRNAWQQAAGCLLGAAEGRAS